MVNIIAPNFLRPLYCIVQRFLTWPKSKKFQGPQENKLNTEKNNANVKKEKHVKEMFQPTTECIDSLTIDDIAGQTVSESGTSRMECSVADSCSPHPQYLQSMWRR